MVSNPLASPSALSNGWNVAFHPLSRQNHHVANEHQETNHSHNQCNNEDGEGIILVSIPLATLYAHDGDAYRAFVPQSENHAKSGNAIKAKAAKAALADYTARAFSNLLPIHNNTDSHIVIQTMGQSKHSLSGNHAVGERRKRRKKIGGKKTEVPIPFVLERTDCMVVQCSNNDSDILQFSLYITYPTSLHNGKETMKQVLDRMLSSMLDRLKCQLTSSVCYAHVACVVLQRQLRAMLQPPRKSKIADSATNTNHNHQQYLNAVAFIADGSLLPRKSGRSMLPMSSPPAVPFVSPDSEQLTRVVTVEVGTFWKRFLDEDGSVVEAVSKEDGIMDGTSIAEGSSVKMRGMIIPRGVTLIVGGGYHGKSTILQALSMGIYDKISGDGRERCVTHVDAVSVRAEDGRYVHNTNVSAFISNLPSGKSLNGASISSKRMDTTRFGTKDASGSTSQAANVTEALEAGASTLLIDEDVSAANFMARDGRMRAMIMDEPITPLLYRVNGLFLCKEHEVSTVVVVGGVGEWLDVADAVVLMKDYSAYDGLKKARSVSYQFSYGHVQYAGRGVVHRLPWEVKEESKAMNTYDGDGMLEDQDEIPTVTKTLSPLRRRPESNCVANKFQDAAVHLLGSGSSRLLFYPDNDEIDSNKVEAISNKNSEASAPGIEDDEEDDGIADMSKCSQLVAGNAFEHLYGCGICVLWLIQQSQHHPEEDLPDLLDRMEYVLNHSSMGFGMNELIASLKRSQNTITTDKNMLLTELLSSHTMLDLWETVGFAYRPRRHEVAMALTRMRGMRFDILPDKPKVIEMVSPEEETTRLEEESRKKALAELWANRRGKR